MTPNDHGRCWEISHRPGFYKFHPSDRHRAHRHSRAMTDTDIAAAVNARMAIFKETRDQAIRSTAGICDLHWTEVQAVVR